MVGNTHYISVFGKYPASNSLEFRKHFLDLSPIKEEDFLDAAGLFDYVEYVPNIHGKSFSNVVAIVGDNTATNKAFARLDGHFLPGAAATGIILQ